jgi:hypothetical protein
MATNVADLPRGSRRVERLAYATRKGRREERRRGRAWINGREVGGTDPRFAHLSASHD